jgi:hypothetical protein
MLPQRHPFLSLFHHQSSWIHYTIKPSLNCSMFEP